MTRRTRRRVYVATMAAAVGAGAPLWAPAVLARLPGFRVEEVRVVGTHYVPPDRVASLASVEPDASVWDDPARWEARVRSDPMIADARVRRTGAHRIEIHVTEIEPVALVPTPDLVPVDSAGHLLPLDPAQADLDLPILGSGATVEGGHLSDPGSRRLLDVLDRLRSAEPGFVRSASQFLRVPGGVEVFMTGGGDARRVYLPDSDPEAGLRRVEAALAARGGGSSAARVDARFDGQVVVAGKGES
ncbi:MAG: FtsQ-type POTRA domain-containing protein [Candidatus Palauibacterales bacterium]|nr:FtsQ-type POTRA domain-containing protein [Candidatus Palauibacterales bacterium]MDP2530797.1 FtsQ-type POTRA domain-containing protein [Candidatus Palauibacterales bacterium]MDP2583129.1 FtsQ-type POTRA domain-containing protein [Candidatus Palauibacterales bacterium]